LITIFIVRYALICEGIATALSLHEATGLTVLAAFSAKNLEAVARMVGDRYGETPGFVVVLGEDEKRDSEIHQAPRHIWFLAEAETEDIETLCRKCRKLKEGCQFGLVLTDMDDQFKVDLWRKFAGHQLHLGRPPVEGQASLDFAGQLIKRHLHSQKTMHFGNDSRLPSYLLDLIPEQLSSGRLEQFPASCDYTS
jgi:hypothetical protein